MALKIQWQPPLVLEERKRAQWEKIIRDELGELENPPEVSLRFEEASLRWKVDATMYRARLVDALRATGKPVA